MTQEIESTSMGVGATVRERLTDLIQVSGLLLKEMRRKTFSFLGLTLGWLRPE